MSLNTLVKRIQNIMRKDVGIDGDAQRISQLGWILFLKIWDDREIELQLIDDDFSSPLTDVSWNEAGVTQYSEDLRWRTWASNDEGLTGDALLDFVNNELFPALRGMLLKSVNEGEVIRKRQTLLKSVFSDSFQYMKSGTLLRQVINIVETDIDFNNSENRHVFGDIYEIILKDLQSAGNAGEYYTPRAATQFAVEMVNPKLGETILDPACGTGGFLTGCIEHLRNNCVNTPDQEKILHDSIFGIEKKPLPHLLCTTNLIVNGIDTPSGLKRDNTLSRPLRDYSSKDRVDVILTNPPFGGIEEEGVELNFPSKYRTKETADLFLILIITLLKNKGRAAVILPDGSLYGDGVKQRIKEKLLEDCNLHTIVRLPKSVFAPYTTIATNILFFTKGEPTKEIWYFEHPLPTGYKGYSKTKPMRLEEFDLEKDWWMERVENQHAWRVSIDEVRDNNFNLDFENPNQIEELKLDPLTLERQFKEQLLIKKRILEELTDSLSEVLRE